MDQDTIAQVLDAATLRRAERRRFLRAAGGATVAVAGSALLAACDDDDDDNIGGMTPTPTPTATTAPAPTPTPTSAAVPDADVLNFALNLEYLEAQYYSYAATGAGLPSDLVGGQGAQGAVTGGQRVNFSDPVVAQYAREIAQDERAHVAFLRRALGGSAVAQPAIDIGTAPNGAFSSAARAAGLVQAGQSFNPYSSDENFLLGAYIFEDVGVTAYKGASILITNLDFLEAAAGILAAEAYHAGLVRTVLYRKGIATPALIDATEAISNARDSLDGDSDLDQGVRPVNNASNLVPTNADSIAFSRSPGQVLNIVYLNNRAVMGGGFFPNGVNGNVKTSAGAA